ncbi:tRNA glutamyl-Q(34) synthetase GluQRS [Limnobacter humi]|uniref:Glutamyl-Q tRNA(Asp) synthetase n=1 Tax=Limnobacter humi TaxID=1778671 RepID=A0ABT1WCQ1_9BURK|nr:tRNA glutamyl-Q(34) synthetase GluQRS [Limnobacter humi]MCQ8895154.1 tRNA glutamyl-Q(34) synthetase GluQRS [Limnobacter humi]
MDQQPYIGRFAPSPTGPLHLGSLATALGSWLDARVNGGRWLVRIEDIDEERCKPEHSAAILHALNAHGLQADGDVWIQSARHVQYQQALDQLLRNGLVYPCGCTRRDIDEANAHRPFGTNRVYPGTCRHGLPSGTTPRALRFRVPHEPTQWTDWRLGSQTDKLEETSGDFVLKRGDGHWAYHLVVVVDDLASNVTHIVRGEDLADTTGRQVALFKALGATAPRYAHLPVILAEDGQKLSKQTGAQALDCAKPIDNLNRVWMHFGEQPMPAQGTVTDWLEQAMQKWPVVMQRLAHKRRP